MKKSEYMNGINLLIEKGVASFEKSEYTSDLISIYSGVKHYTGEQWEYVCERIEKPTHWKDFGSMGSAERFDIVGYVLRRTREIVDETKRRENE